ELGTHHLAKLWNDLAGSDAAKAYQAIGALAQAAGGEVVPFFEGRLRPAVGVTRKQIEERIHELNNDRFSVREKARRELEKLGSLAGESLREAAKRKPPLEVQNVIRKLLERVEGTLTLPDELQAARAVEVLEYIGDDAARALLGKYAGGDSRARLTQEARWAL